MVTAQVPNKGAATVAANGVESKPAKTAEKDGAATSGPAKGWRRLRLKDAGNWGDLHESLLKSL